MDSAKNIVQQLLKKADITLNGHTSGDIQVHNAQFYPLVLNYGALGLGESYMAGWWDAEAVDIFIEKIIRAHLHHHLKLSKTLLFKIFLNQFWNLQSKKRAFQVGEKHYDLDNTLFQSFLDPGMNYTCGYWKNATSLEAAQQAKLELTCQKLLLKPGMRLLDIGCGWGGLAKYAAERFKVSVVGITISKDQYEYASLLCRGLPVEIRYQDYRSLDRKNDQFDRIVSLGMFEHVGFKNYQTYMSVVKRSLRTEGIFLLHTIGNMQAKTTNPWTLKYIFPNGSIPSMTQIAKAAGDKFVVEDLHNFGADYDKTLMAWHQNFIAHWPKLSARYDARFKRMWAYYLLSSAGAFRARNLQLWQFVFSENGLNGGYEAPRSVQLIPEAFPHYAKPLENILR